MLKFTRELIKFQVTILRKKNNAGDIKAPNFKLYYRPVKTKTAWSWHQKKYVDS